MNDIDIEMWEAGQIADGLANARKHGVCPHLSAKGFGPVVCTDGCGITFATEQDWFDAMDDVRSEWT